MTTRVALIPALILAISGCFGGGGDGGGRDVTGAPTQAPPPAPPPVTFKGGLWSGAIDWQPGLGQPAGRVNVRALLAETGELRLVLYRDIWEDYFSPDNEQVFGTFAIEHGLIKTTGDAVWTLGTAGSIRSNGWFGSFGMIANHWMRDRIAGPYRAVFPGIEDRAGTLTVNYHSVYERPSSLDRVRGSYRTPTESLAIDAQGAIFYQSPATGCTANGAVEVIDTRYNMYRVRLDVANCTGDDAARNGLAFTGLANIGENNDLTGGFLNATLEMALSAAYPDASGNRRYMAWALRAHKD